MSNERPQVLVTGGAKRVGRAIALAFAENGCDVHISYHGSEREAEETIRLCARHGSQGRMWFMPMHEMDRLAERCGAIISAGGSHRWQAVVLNASRYVPSTLAELSPERLIEDYAVNAAAPALVARSFAPVMGDGGAIVTMCDIHAMGEIELTRKGHVSYGMSKAALLEMTMSLAKELAPRVRVNAVAPGVVAWPESGPEADAAMQARYLSRVPMGRAGTVEEAAEAVRWLAMEATYCTGQVIRVDGGRGM